MSCYYRSTEKSALISFVRILQITSLSRSTLATIQLQEASAHDSDGANMSFLRTVPFPKSVWNCPNLRDFSQDFVFF